MTRISVDCSELAATIAKIAFNLGSRPNVNTVDDVVREMGAVVAGIDRNTVVEAIVEATTFPRKSIGEAAKSLAAIKHEAKADKALQTRIAKLEQHLQNQTLPERPLKPDATTDAIKRLQKIRSDIQKRLAQSDPAVAKRLSSQIDKLTKQIEAEDYAIPVRREDVAQSHALKQLRYARDALRTRINHQIRAMKPKTISERIATPANLARAIITSIDLSAIGRQGFLLGLSHPNIGLKAIGPTLTAALSKDAAAKTEAELMSRYNAPLYARAKLFLSTSEAALTQREEVYQTTWAEKIPLVAASARAYSTYLNVMRADAFDTLVSNMSRDAEPTLEEMRAVANYVNQATGRGSLGGFEKSAVALNTVFFAPRYVASRFAMLLGQPLWRGNKQTRKLIAKEYAKIAIGFGVVYGLAALAGADLEDDPRSADFGKIKIGKTRIDPLAGVAQGTVMLSRVFSGTTKSSMTGRVQPIRGKLPYGGQDTGDVVWSFVRSKFSPGVGAIFNVLSGQNVIGEKVTAGTVARDLTVPLALRDIKEAIQDQGVPAGSALGLAAILGFGLQTYPLPPADSAPLKDKERYYRREMAQIYRRGGRFAIPKELKVWGIKHKVPRRAIDDAKAVVRRELYDPLWATIAAGDTVKQMQIRRRLRQLGATPKDIAKATENRSIKARERTAGR